MNEITKQPMSTTQLELLGIRWYSADTVPKMYNGESFILNWDVSTGPGTHYIAVKTIKKRVYYFDSLCFPIHDDVAEMFHNSYIKKVRQNGVKCQQEEDVICGALATIFLKKVGSEEDFLGFLREYKIQNGSLVVQVELG